MNDRTDNTGLVGDGDVQFVVVRSVGEYSDRDDVPIASYREKRNAKAHVVTATEAEAGIPKPYYRDDARYFLVPVRFFRAVPSKDAILGRQYIPYAEESGE